LTVFENFIRKISHKEHEEREDHEGEKRGENLLFSLLCVLCENSFGKILYRGKYL